MNIKKKTLNTLKWKKLDHQIFSLTEERSLTIGIIGKYTELNDSYKSLLEAIFHAGIYHNYKVHIEWINAREDTYFLLQNIDGIIIPGGFGLTGIETIVSLIKEVREAKIPTLGICLGMQLMVIEFFRDVIQIENLGSEEFGNDHPNIISQMKDISNQQMCGTMRLCKFKIQLNKSRIKKIYGTDIIHERHRHRYSINQEYSNYFNNRGLMIVGQACENNIIEIIELNETLHPWYIGTQYHPEYQSSPFNPHPLFLSFIQHCINKIK